MPWHRISRSRSSRCQFRVRPLVVWSPSLRSAFNYTTLHDPWMSRQGLPPLQACQHDRCAVCICAVCPADYGDPCDDITCPCKTGQALVCYQDKCALCLMLATSRFSCRRPTMPLVCADFFDTEMQAVCITSLCVLRGPAALDSEGMCHCRHLLCRQLHRRQAAPKPSHAGAQYPGGRAHW